MSNAPHIIAAIAGLAVLFIGAGAVLALGSAALIVAREDRNRIAATVWAFMAVGAACLTAAILTPIALFILS